MEVSGVTRGRARGAGRAALPWLAAAALALSAAGCGIVKVTWPEQKAAPFSYHGSECRSRSYDDSDRSEVTRRLCEPGWHSDSTQTVLDIGKRHRTFDDRRPDMLVAAIQTIDCSRACERSPLALGMASFYAGILDPAKLRAALGPIELSDDGREAFVTLATQSKDDVLQRVKKLDPRRQHMYVEVPGEVISKRRAYFEKHADLYRELDALLDRAKKIKKAGADATEIARDMTAVRGKYLERCGAADCRFDPFVYEVTRALVLLHVVTKQNMLAYAEEELIQNPAAGRRRFGVEVGFAVYQAMEEERKAAEEYQRSKSAGMDKATLEARFGTTPPIPVDPDTDYVAPEVAPRLTPVGAREGGFESESGIFRAKKDAAGKTGALGEALDEVAFKDNVSTEDVTSCYETNRVTGVHFDSDNHARLEFETNCAVVGTKTNVEKIPPIFVPKSEAAKLVPGELIIAAIDPKSRAGVILRAEATAKAGGKEGKKSVTPVTQIRGHRLPTK